MIRLLLKTLPGLARRSNLYSSKVRLHLSAARVMSRFSGKVLDIGAGSQPFRHYLPARCDYVSMEVVASQIGDVVADARAIPFKSGIFDGVVCTEVLEHVPIPALVLEEIDRISKPGAMVYVSVPMTWGLHYDPYDYFRFTRYGLIALFERNGFVIEEVVRIGGLFTMVLARLTDTLLVLLYRAAFPLKYLIGSANRVTLVSLLAFPAVALLDLAAAALDRIVPGADRDCLGWAVLASKPGRTGSR